jgi:hypothetical protein
LTRDSGCGVTLRFTRIVRHTKIHGTRRFHQKDTRSSGDRVAQANSRLLCNSVCCFRCSMLVSVVTWPRFSYSSICYT